MAWPHHCWRWTAAILLGCTLAPPVRAETPPVRSQPPQAAKNEDLEGALKRFDDFQNAIFLLSRDFNRFGDPDLVVIPIRQWEEFLKTELARRSENKSVAAITSYALTGSLGEDRAMLEAEVGVRVDGEEGATLDLAMHEAQMTESGPVASKAGVGAEEAAVPVLRRDASGAFQLTVNRPGIHSFRFRFFVDVDRGPDESRLALSLPSSPVKSVQLTSAEPLLYARDSRTGRNFELSPDRRTVRPLLRGEDSLSVAWRTAGDRRGGGVAAVSSTGKLFYRVNESMIETEAQLVIEARGQAREWSFLLPPGEQVHSVSADRQGRLIDPQAEVIPEERQSRLRIRFAEPLTGQVSIRVLSERPRPSAGQSTEIGRFELENAESQKGLVLVFAGPDLSVRVRPRRGVQRIAPVQLDPALQRDQPFRTYRYYLQPAALDLEVENAQPVVTASSKTDLLVSAERGELQTQFRFSIRRAHTDKLTLRVPSPLADLSVSPPELVENVSVREAPGQEGKEVLLTLVEPKIGELDVSVRGSIPFKGGGAQQIRLPIFAGGGDSSGTLAVRESSNARIAFVAAKTKNLSRQPIPATDEFADEPLWYFRLERGAPELAFSVERLPQQIEAAIESEFRRQAGGVAVKSLFRFRAKHEPMQQVLLRLPPGISGVKIEGENLSPRRRIGAGQAALPLDNPAEFCELLVEYLAPVAEPDYRSVSVPMVLPEKVAITSYKGDVWCDAGLHASADPPWESGPPSPTRLVPGSERPSLVVRTTSPTEQLVLHFEPSAALAALVVPRMVQEDRIAQARRLGRVRYLVARHRIRSAEVSLPPQTRLLDVLIDAEPASFTQEENLCRVQLPSADRPFSLEIVYDAPAALSLGAFGSISLAAPTLLDDVAIEESLRLLHASSDRLLLYPLPTMPSWSWIGFLRLSASPRTGRDAAEWLRVGDLSLRWDNEGAASAPLRAEDGRTYVVSGIHRPSPGSADGAAAAKVFLVREPLWILLLSGSVLVAGLASLRTRPRTRTRAAAGFAVAVFAGLLAAPQATAWFWFGAQWGAYLVAILYLAHALNRRRRRALVLRQRVRARGRGLSMSASSILRRVPSTVGAVHIPSTVDAGVRTVE